jgi:uncharacterized protein (TIGR00725 family)
MVEKTFTIAVVGAEDASQEILTSAKNLGAKLAHNGLVVATGAVGGFGMWAAMGAHEGKGMTIGFSPASSKKEHEEHFRQPTDYLQTIVYTGFGYLGRDLLLTRSADAIVIGLGDQNSIHELLLAHELNKPVFVLHGGHDADTLQTLLGDVYNRAKIHTSIDDVVEDIKNIQ